MYCTNCGNKIEKGSIFCANCGKQLSNKESNSAHQTNTEAPSSKLSDIIWGYVLDKSSCDITQLKEAIEKKNDYKLIEPEIIKDNIYFYQNGQGNRSKTVIFYDGQNKIYIFGDESGLATFMSRFKIIKIKSENRVPIFSADLPDKIVKVLVNFREKKEQLANWVTKFQFLVCSKCGSISRPSEIKTSTLVNILTLLITRSLVLLSFINGGKSNRCMKCLNSKKNKKLFLKTVVDANGNWISCILPNGEKAYFDQLPANIA